MQSPNSFCWTETFAMPPQRGEAPKSKDHETYVVENSPKDIATLLNHPNHMLPNLAGVQSGHTYRLVELDNLHVRSTIQKRMDPS